MAQRVTFYIDGFNFYYGLRRTKRTEPQWGDYYWIDIVKLCAGFLGEDQVVEKVIYFTASPLNPEKSSRQSAFLNATFIAMEQSLTKQAVDVALEAYRLYPQDNEIIEMTAEALLSDGQYAAAERILSLLSENDKTAGFFYINLARTQLGLGEKKLAKHNLKRAVKAGSHPS